MAEFVHVEDISGNQLHLPPAGRSIVLSIMLLILATGITTGEVYAQKPASETFTFVALGIPLSDAFDKFITQSGLSIAFEIDLVAGKKAYCRALNLSAEDVLKCLLKDTALDFIRLSSGTYVLIEQAKVQSQWGGITGRVVDVASGEPLANAHVLLAEAGIGDVTNGAGRFAFSRLKPGPHRLIVSYVGYSDIADTVEVIPEANAPVELGMRAEPILTSPIVISGLVNRFSSETLLAEERDVKGFLEESNESDLIRSLNTITGIRVGDAMADVHVQGGGAGEHQYRLDGAPVFIPIPNGGLIGPFSPFALEKFTVNKAGFSAAKGSYLSGVIEAEHRLTPLTGNMFDVQLDPFSLNARAMGGRRDNSNLGINWMIAARKSLWSIYQPGGLQTHLLNWSSPDLLVLNNLFPRGRWSEQEGGSTNPLEYLSENQRAEFTGADFTNNFDFHDLHGALRVHLGPLRSLHASFYRGGNTLGDDSIVLGNFQTQLPPGGNGPENDFERRLLKFQNSYQWNNTVAQLKYEHVLGSKTFAEWGGWYSRFDGVQRFDHESYQGAYKTSVPDSLNRVPGGYRFSQDALKALGFGYNDTNKIAEIGLRATVNHTVGQRNFVSGGIEAVRDRSDFVLNLQGVRRDTAWAPNQASLQADQLRFAAFVDNKFNFSKRTVLETGVRLTYMDTHKLVYAEPRVALRHDAETGPLGAWAFRGALGVYRQFINQFDITSVNQNALIPSMRFWLPLDKAQHPARAMHASGAFLLMPHHQWQLQLETYYKWQPHLWVIDYANAALFGGAPANITSQEDLLHKASGFAYGAALSIERSTKQLTTRVQYEFSVAEQKVSNRFDGRMLSVPWNVPHSVNTSFAYSINEYVTVVGRLENKIGQTWAFRGVYYNFLEPDPNINIKGPYNLSDPEAHKLPMISHLDFGVSVSQKLKHSNLQIRFDMSNLLSFSNVEEWSLVYDAARDTYFKIERPMTPFLPSVVVRVGF